MNPEAIIATLLSAAAFLKKPVQDAATRSVKDLLDAARYYVRRKLGGDSDAAKVLDLAIEKPESAMRKAVLAEELAVAGLHADADLVRLVEQLAALVPTESGVAVQHVRVVGDRNHVQVAGRDLIHTERVVRRNAITPDERHLTIAQREKIRELIARLAGRFPGAENRGKLSAAHAMVQRRFSVASYLLIPVEQYHEAVAYLNQQCAIRRSALLRRDPAAHRGELCRVVFAAAGTLGWDRARVHQFATERLGLKNPLGALNELGPNQLKSLADFMRRQTRRHAA